MTIDQARRLQWVSRWHRRMAVVVMAWLAVLAASGILVNHANDWGLDQKPLAEPLQRWVYGVEAIPNDFCETAPEAGRECGAVFARLELPSGLLLLTRHALLLVSAEGQLVERLPAVAAGLADLEAGFARGSVVYLRDAATTVRTDPDLLDFQPAPADETSGAAWQTRQAETPGLTWERLLLDVHAARFLGPFAKAFNDLVGGMILLLALSGGWLHRLKVRNGLNGGS